MFGGVLTILIAIWVYRTAVQAKTSNALLWAAGAAVVFFAVQMLFYNINIFIIEGFTGDINEEYDRDLVSVGDRAAVGGQGGIQEGFLGTIMGILFEILPLFMGWATVAVIRTKYMLKQALNWSNLSSGITDMFSSIANSFKTSN